MNWTESALNRHSRRNGRRHETARQKEYFAKARLRRRQGPSSVSSPRSDALFVPDFVPQPSIDGGPGPAVDVLRPNTWHDSESQEIVTVPSNGLDASSPAESIGDRARQELESTGLMPTNGNSSLEVRRQRLLDIGDWTGTKLQKPLVISYEWRPHHRTSALTRDLDRIPHSQDAALAAGFLDRHGSDSRHRGPDQYHPGPLRLRIGSQSLRWSQDGNTIRSPSRKSSSFTEARSVSTHSSSPPHHQPTICTKYDEHSLSWPSTQSRNQGAQTSHPDFCASDQLQPHLPPVLESAAIGSGNPYYAVRSPPIIHQPRPSRKDFQRILQLTSPDLEVIRRNAVDLDQSATAQLWEGSQQEPWSGTSSVGSSTDMLYGESLRPLGPRNVNHEHIDSPPSDDEHTSLRGSEESRQSAHKQTGQDSDLSTRSGDSLTASWSKAGWLQCSNNLPRGTFAASPPREGKKRRLNSPQESNLTGPCRSTLPEPPNIQSLIDILHEEDEPASLAKLGHAGNAPRTISPDMDHDGILRKRFHHDDDPAVIVTRLPEQAIDGSSEDWWERHVLIASDVVEPSSSGTSPERMTVSSVTDAPAPGIELPDLTGVMGTPALTSAVPTDSPNKTTAVLNNGSPDEEACQTGQFRPRRPMPLVGGLSSAGSVDRTPPSPRKRYKGLRRPGIGIARTRTMVDDDPIESDTGC